MPEKMGNTFKNTALVSPLNAEPGKADPGPVIMNNPLMLPKDKDDFLSEATKPGGGSKRMERK
jgi:hypothetical protein